MYMYTYIYVLFAFYLSGNNTHPPFIFTFIDFSCLIRAFYLSTEENQTSDGGDEAESNNSHEKEARPGDEEERNIGAPLVLPPQRVAEIHRRLHRLQEQLKRLQVRGEMKREE